MADLDLLIRGGTVVDSTGAPARTADIAVRDGTIVEIGRVDATADEVVDADGLLVTPGFVDVHTHYDAQLHWDPTASPASWHGVTTLMTGNCGFTLAPSKPEDLEWLLLMLSRVEGMSADALRAGVAFDGGTLGEFLAGLDGRLGVNVGANVGHCAVRRYVMGDDASERAATDDEIAQMCALVRAAFRDGAIGFTSSQLELHVAHDGRGVPSNHASPDELVALAAVLREVGRGRRRPGAGARDGAGVGAPGAPQHLDVAPARAGGVVPEPRVRGGRSRRRTRGASDVRDEPAGRALLS